MPLTAWDCPKCGRRFARTNQGHECSPAMTVEEYFSTGPAHERPVFEAVMAHCRGFGDVHVEPVSVGIFLKRSRTFVELRPRDRWVAVSFMLDRRARHRVITRKVNEYNGRFWHIANVTSAEDVDDDLLALISEAYEQTP